MFIEWKIIEHPWFSLCDSLINPEINLVLFGSKGVRFLIDIVRIISSGGSEKVEKYKSMMEMCLSPRSMMEMCLSPACNFSLITRWRFPLVSSWLSMAHSPMWDASVKMVHPRWKSGSLQAGPVISRVSNLLKVSSESLNHWISPAFLLWVGSDKGASISLKFWIKRLS